ncbi:hypothetical protein RKD19_007873 [Streptomyces canus]|uniref:hypothetical protein n=1 Tax=unclassified Streptomyces TaxID=2593676 RepID=UPI000F64F22E|nr:hypothetical protein [Streptomyces sp. RP5T]RRR87294.1 hypothetical protein EHS43_01490 [Streptomyces sp. RP5T]
MTQPGVGPSVPTLLGRQPRPPAHTGFDRLAVVVAAPDMKRLELAVDDRRGKLAEAAEYARENAKCYSDWFTRNGHASPLAGQLRAVADGRPLRGPAPVRALLHCELSHGVLMGVQDFDAVRGPVRVEYAAAGDEFAGFRSTVTCGAGEPVLRDDAGIFASVFQGPDARTGITRDTERLLFLVFDAPGLSPERFEAAVHDVSALLDEAGGAPRAERVDLA